MEDIVDEVCFFLVFRLRAAWTNLKTKRVFSIWSVYAEKIDWIRNYVKDPKTFDLHSIFETLSSNRFVCDFGTVPADCSGCSGIEGISPFSKKNSYWLHEPYRLEIIKIKMEDCCCWTYMWYKRLNNAALMFHVLDNCFECFVRCSNHRRSKNYRQIFWFHQIGFTICADPVQVMH